MMSCTTSHIFSVRLKTAHRKYSHPVFFIIGMNRRNKEIEMRIREPWETNRRESEKRK